MKQILPEISKENIKIYSIAFTEMSAIVFLEDVAKSTGGFLKFAKSDQDVHIIFTSLYEKIKSPDSLPLEGDYFSIDPNVQEAILMITKKIGASTELLDPQGKLYSPKEHASNITWYPAPVFDMIAIQEPARGKWKVKLSSREGNKIFIVTNLRLKSSFDKNFVGTGKKILIEAFLEKDGGLVKETEILEQVSFFAEISSPDDRSTKIPLMDNITSGDKIPGDGIYSGEFLVERAVEYTMKISVESKTFKREKIFQFKGTEPKGPPPTQVREKKSTVKPLQPLLPKIPKKERGSWSKVGIKLGEINWLIIGGAVGVYFGWRMIGKGRMGKRKKSYKEEKREKKMEKEKRKEERNDALIIGKNEGTPEKKKVEVSSPVMKEEADDPFPPEFLPADRGAASWDIQEKFSLTKKALEKVGAEKREKDERFRQAVDLLQIQLEEIKKAKNTWDQAQQKFHTVQKSNRDYQQKALHLMDPAAMGTEFEEAITMLGMNNEEMEAGVEKIEKEGEALSVKIKAWEEELKGLEGGTGGRVKGTLAAGDGNSREKEELMRKVKDLEKALQIKEQYNDSLQKTYADLEKEYVTLSAKIKTWEEELKGLEGGAGGRVKGALAAGDGNSREKEELMRKVRDLEKALQVKEQYIDSLQKTYADLEKEYMTLYRQYVKDDPPHQE
jgi:prefoldin subunit 5